MLCFFKDKKPNKMAEIVSFIKNNYNINKGFTCYPDEKLIESNINSYVEDNSYIMMKEVDLNGEKVLFATYMTVAKDKRQASQVLDIKRRMVEYSLEKKIKVCYSIGDKPRGVFSQDVIMITKPLHNNVMYKHGLLDKKLRYENNVKQQDIKLKEEETDDGFVVHVEEDIKFYCVPVNILNEEKQTTLKSVRISHADGEINESHFDSLFSHLKSNEYASVMWYNIGNLYVDKFFKNTFQSNAHLNWNGKLEQKVELNKLNIPIF